MNRLTVLLLVCVIALGAAAHAAPPAGLIKLGTIAPTDSSFHKILTAMGTKWSQIPGGPSLRIYAGGTAGGEADMVMKMKIGQIDAALLSAEGLAEVDPAVKSVQCIPMMFHSLEEVDYVVEKIGPRLDQRLREKGFVVLFWGDAGWVRFFSTSVVRSPDDLKKTKLFTWAGDTQTFDIYKSAGFHPVALETADILPMLRTGMINAAPLPPYVALSTQVYSGAKNMIALNWAPLVGALVITERAWNRLPPAAQLAMARAAVEAGREIKKQNRSESDRAVEAMKKLGLNVYEPTPAVEAVWRATAEVTYPKIRGGLVPSAYFDEVQRLIEQYRATVRTP